MHFRIYVYLYNIQYLEYLIIHFTNNNQNIIHQVEIQVLRYFYNQNLNDIQCIHYNLDHCTLYIYFCRFQQSVYKYMIEYIDHRQIYNRLQYLTNIHFFDIIVNQYNLRNNFLSQIHILLMKTLDNILKILFRISLIQLI